MKPWRCNPAATTGFSLIELLITLALMVILTTMMWGFGSARHQRSQRCNHSLFEAFSRDDDAQHGGLLDASS